MKFRLELSGSAGVVEGDGDWREVPQVLLLGFNAFVHDRAVLEGGRDSKERAAVQVYRPASMRIIPATSGVTALVQPDGADDDCG